MWTSLAHWYRGIRVGKHVAQALVLLVAALACCGAAAEEDVDGIQPGEQFTGAGPSGPLRLHCPPRIMVCVYTEPVTDRRSGRPPDALPPDAQERLADQLLNQPGGGSKEIRFRASGGTEDVDALDRLYVVVASNARHWRVVAEATDLVAEEAVIPAHRLSTRHWNSGGAYLSLGAPIEVATGGRQKPRVVNTMYFRARIEAGDRRGTYTGKINFTGLICP